MKHHRKSLRLFLRSRMRCEAEAEEIIVKLMHGEAYDKKFEELAAKKFKRKWLMEYKGAIEKEVFTVERCAQMKEEGGMSGKGWERMIAAYRKTWDTVNREYSPIGISTGVPGEDEMECPQPKCRNTLRRHLEKYSAHLGIKTLVADGSAVAMYTVVGAITQLCFDAGYAWCRNRLVEILFSGDAHGTLRRKKMTHFCLKGVGAQTQDNSPYALWGLCHWQGGDDWDSLKEFCASAFDAIRLLQQNGSTVAVNFPEGELVVKLDLLLTSDAAFLDAEAGHTGFAVEESCVACKCPKAEFGDATHKIWDLKTEEYLNHSSHMPVDDNYNFDCPHSQCDFKCRSKTQWCAEQVRLKALTKSGVKSYKQQHKYQYPLRHKLICLPVTSTIPDTMHFLMNTIVHHWTHAIAFYIDSDELATHINELLHRKCGVVIDMHKVSEGHIMDAARLPTLPGPASLKVAEYFDLFLDAVFHWEGRNRDNRALLSQKANASASMDALLVLWNELLEPMEADKNGDSTEAERNDKADLIQQLVEDWRDAYRHAFGADNCKPYTHMALHFAPCQRRVQHDLIRYSCQSQEHYGKIAKYIVRNRTNFLLGKKVKRWRRVEGKDELQLVQSDSISKGYVEQCVQQIAYKTHLKRVIPVKETEHDNAMRKAKRSRHQHAEKNPGVAPAPRKSVIKKSEWDPHHVVMSERNQDELSELM